MTGPAWLAVGELDARVLRATDPLRALTAERVGELVGCSGDVAASCLGRLRVRMLVEPDRYRPRGWRRTRWGDVALEHAP
jgi:hypothetical protein